MVGNTYSSVTLAPNVHVDFLEKDTSLIDMAGYEDKRNYVGVIEYKDESGVHASGTIPVAFTINQGPTLPPSPSPKSKPKPAPVDTCKNQIRN